MQVDNTISAQSKEMDMTMECLKTKSSEPQILQPRKWRGLRTLETVQHMNAHLLGVLVSLAKADGGRHPLEIVNRYRDRWLEFDTAMLQRAASNPVLLLNVHFQNEDWWRWAMRGRSGTWRNIRTLDAFPQKMAGELMRAALMLAWPTAREDRHASRLLFGMSSAVAQLVGALTAPVIESIASRHSRELRPRWEDLPTFWESLLVAALSGDDVRLREVHLYSLQVVASELCLFRG
jgi:hypothetical protein